MNHLSKLMVVAVSVAAFGQAAPLRAAPGGRKGASATLAGLVPASTGVFVEFVDLQSLYPAGRSSPVWRAAVKLIGLEAGPGGEGVAAGPVGAQLGLSTKSAVAALFGRDVALALPSIKGVEEGVLLARLPARSHLNTILRARPWKLEGAAHRLRRYVLESGLTLATDGRVVLIGQRRAERPFMQACLDLLGGAGGESLAATKSFTALIERFPDRRVGLAYWDWSGGEGADWPTVAGADRLLSRLRRAAIACVKTEGGLGFHLSAESAEGAVLPAFRAGPSGGALSPPLPKDTWLAATVAASPEELLSWIQSRSATGAGALFVQLLGGALVGSQPGDDLFGYLDRPTTLVVGPPPEAVPGWGRPGLPRVAFVARARDAAGAMRVFDRAMERLIRFVNLRLTGPALEGAQTGPLRVESESEAEDAARYVSLLPLAAPGDSGDPSRELELAWCVAGEHFLVASDLHYLSELRSALRAGSGAEDVSVTSPGRQQPTPRGAEAPWLKVEGRVGRLAELASQWLDYVAWQHPELLADEGWSLFRSRRQRRQVELGAGLKADPNQPGKVLVVRTFRGWPAQGVLRGGDYIVGLQERLLALDDPLADLRAGLAGRAGDAVVLRVERGGRFLDAEVRLGAPAGGPEVGGSPLLAVEPLLAAVRTIDEAHLSVVPSASLLYADMEIRFSSAPTVTTVGPGGD